MDLTIITGWGKNSNLKVSQGPSHTDPTHTRRHKHTILLSPSLPPSFPVSTYLTPTSPHRHTYTVQVGEESRLHGNSRRFVERAFDPPLAVREVPGNAGRFVIPVDSLSRWCAAHQRRRSGHGQAAEHDGDEWL